MGVHPESVIAEPQLVMHVADAEVDVEALMPAECVVTLQGCAKDVHDEEMDPEAFMPAECFVTLQGRVKDVIVPRWLQGSTLLGLDIWRRHGVSVLWVDGNDPDPNMKFAGGERLRVGYTRAAETMEPPQDQEKITEWAACALGTQDRLKIAAWEGVHNWLNDPKWECSVLGALVKMSHKSFAHKQLATIKLQERFGFSPRVIGILRASGTEFDVAEETVEWFPGGSSTVGPGDELLFLADEIDTFLLNAKLDAAFEDERNAFLHEKLLSKKLQLLAPMTARTPPMPTTPPTPPSSRDVSPMSPRSRSTGRSRSRSPSKRRTTSVRLRSVSRSSKGHLRLVRLPTSRVDRPNRRASIRNMSLES